MSVRCTLATLVALAAALPATGQGDSPETPVRVGGSPDLDACAGVGVVMPPRGSASGAAAVLTSPVGGGETLDRLSAGRLVHLCEGRGDWAGIVYHADEGPGECGVSSPLVKRRAYGGPCRSGWMRTSRLSLAAG